MRMLKEKRNLPQFRRLLRLEEEIRSGRRPNCSGFAREYEVSCKTVQRDVDFLRELGAPIEFDRARNGFRYTDPSWRMPHLDLSEGEFLALLLSIRAADLFRDTGLEGELSSLAEKILASLHGPMRADPALFQRCYSFLPMPSRPIRKEIWTALFRAVLDRKVQEMLYATPGRAAPAWRAMEPLHLACIGEEWYLAAFDRSAGEIRNFALSRMREIRDAGERFEPREFDPAVYYRNRFGRYVGRPGEAMPVAVRFSAKAAPWVEERIWHPEQKIRRHRDGSLTLGFPAPSLYEVERWVREWGGEAEIVEPAGAGTRRME